MLIFSPSNFKNYPSGNQWKINTHSHTKQKKKTKELVYYYNNNNNNQYYSINRKIKSCIAALSRFISLFLLSISENQSISPAAKCANSSDKWIITRLLNAKFELLKIYLFILKFVTQAFFDIRQDLTAGRATYLVLSSSRVSRSYL